MSKACIAAKAEFRQSVRPRRIRSITLAFQLIASSLIGSPLIGPPDASAQTTAGGRSEVFPGGELESYLRYLQTAGKSESYPWSIRSFSPSEIDLLAARDSAHPWAHRYDLQRRPQAGGFQWDYIRPHLNFYLNSAYPFGGNDGAVWQGKGLTTSFQGGVSARWGPFSAILAPVAFRAENQSFPLFRNGEAGRLQFADGQFPTTLDRPQRFGVDPYSRIDLGQSTFRFDLFGATAGISTANQWWGPTDNYPYILGNNAAGFPHVFFGTSQPANLYVIKLHTRIVYGKLDQSAYSSVTGPAYFSTFSQPGKRRFMAGLIASLQVRGAPGLEIGGARFFHAANDSSGISSHNLGLPFQNLFKRRLRQETDTAIGGDLSSLKENQLASIFLRWAPPGSGFEVYGEYGREDYSADARDLILEPDHEGTVNIGFRKAWLSGDVMQAFRAEVFNYEWPAGSRTRDEGLIYVHFTLRQGHTYRGQLLGADVGPGSGSAQTLAYDRYTPQGRMTAFVSRVVAHEVRTTYESGPAAMNGVDVMNSIGVEAMRFIGPFDVTARLTLTDDLDRNFITDRANANLQLGIRQAF